MLIELLFQDQISFLMVTVSILFAFTVHEYSHAQAAHSLGDHTPKYKGRLTLNPIAHIDPLGMILLFFAGFGWGKPVPFNPYNLKDQRWGPAFVSLAGPSSNFIMFFISALAIRFLDIPSVGLLSFLAIFAWLNLLLCVFNLLPFPPLDGSHIISAIFPSLESKMSLSGGNFILMIGAVFLMMYIIVPYVLPPIYSLVVGQSFGF